MKNGKAVLTLGVIFAAACANAQVIFSGPQSIAISPTSYHVTAPTFPQDPAAFEIDFNSDGQLDFAMFSYTAVPGRLDMMAGRGLNGAFYAGDGSSSVMKRFEAGVTIGASEGWYIQFLHGIPPGPTGSNAFVGAKFLIGGAFHYGWVEYSLEKFGTGTLYGWAYESQANVAIVAGDRGAALVPVPEPGAYGVAGLMLLAAGIVLKRRREA